MSAELARQIAREVVKEMRSGGMPPVGYVDTKGAAAYLGLSVETMERLRVTGGGPEFIKLTKSVRYRLDDLDSWAESHRRSSTSG